MTAAAPAIATACLLCGEPLTPATAFVPTNPDVQGCAMCFWCALASSVKTEVSRG